MSQKVVIYLQSVASYIHSPIKRVDKTGNKGTYIQDVGAVDHVHTVLKCKRYP